MSRNSVSSYNVPDRIAVYDAEMDIMHPNRAKMIDIALEIMPFDKESDFSALELGAGTGYFTGRFLNKFTNANLIVIEGAASMVDLAEERLGKLTERIDFRTGDFRDIGELISGEEMGKAVFTSYALHHLNQEEKLNIARKVFDFLKPGGWFINSDLIISDDPVIEERIQRLRVDGIVNRACGLNKRFRDYASTRKFLDDLEENEGDQPLTVANDLEIMRTAGFSSPSILWLEHREAVLCGVK